MLCDELKVYVPQDGPWGLEPEEGGKLVEEETCYLKSDVDAAIAELKRKLQDQCISCPVKMQEDDVVAEYQEKILVLEKSYKKLVKRFVHETSVAESYRSLVYKEDALKYQKVGNSEMYEELSKRSDKAYRHANRWRRIFRKMSQEEK